MLSTTLSGIQAKSLHETDLVPGLKILHIETGMNLYGGARQVVWLLRGLSDAGVDNVLMCPTGSAIAQAAFPNRVSVIATRMRGDHDLGFIGRALRQIRHSQPDVVHLHSRRGADWFGGIAAAMAGVPAVISRRVTNPERRPLGPLKYRLCRRVVTISEAIRNGLVDAGVERDKITVVRSAVMPPAEQGLWSRAHFDQEFGTTPDHCVIAVCAQFIARKGHDVLLDALPELVKARCPVRVLLFGKGPLAIAVQDRIEREDLGSVVSIPGFRTDLDRFLHHVDILAHPALDEGLGVALLEASAAGVPVVASAVGGIPEAVRDGVSGILVPPADPGALASALTALADDPERRRNLGEGGRQMMQDEFSVEGMVEGNQRVYRQILAGDAQ